ncbi:hypothetical protein Tco_0880190 [Tanacetum coccineum]
MISYCLITGTEVDIEEIIYSDLGPEDSGALSRKRQKPKSKKTSTKTQVTPPTRPTEGSELSHPVSSGNVPNPQDLERNIQLAGMGLSSTSLDEGTRKSQPLPEGTAKTTPLLEGPLGDKDSEGFRPPADMEPINLSIVDLSGTGAEYPVDKTQFTRPRYQTLSKNEGKTSYEVEPGTEPLQLKAFADVQTFVDELLSSITQVVNLFLEGKCPKMLEASIMIGYSLDGYLDDLHFGVGVSGGSEAILLVIERLCNRKFVFIVLIFCVGWNSVTLTQLDCTTYLDDGIIVGDTSVVGKVLELIMEDGPSCGLHLNVDKTKVFWLKEDPRSRLAGVFPPNIARPLHGVKLLGGPASVDFNFSSELVMKRVAKTIVLMYTVARVNDPQCELLLLRACAGISKLYFVMRKCSHECLRWPNIPLMRLFVLLWSVLSLLLDLGLVIGNGDFPPYLLDLGRGGLASIL